MSDSSDKYRISVGGYSAGSPVDAGDSISGADPKSDGQQFSTIDEDNDQHGSIHCAQEYTGAWWYSSCLSSNLNGFYFTPGPGNPEKEGVIWHSFRGYEYSLKSTKMKMKPVPIP